MSDLGHRGGTAAQAKVDLPERLRRTCRNNHHRQQNCQCHLIQAADALSSDAQRIAELEKQRDDYCFDWNFADTELEHRTFERDALQDEIKRHWDQHEDDCKDRDNYKSLYHALQTKIAAIRALPERRIEYSDEGEGSYVGDEFDQTNDAHDLGYSDALKEVRAILDRP
jgi:hypothetical protein